MERECRKHNKSRRMESGSREEKLCERDGRWSGLSEGKA